MKTCGLRVARQSYQYRAAGKNITGQNVYAILQGPRADATEAVVLIGAWRNMDKVLNQSGVALVLTMARYFKSEHHGTPRDDLNLADENVRMVTLVQRHYFLNRWR